MVNCCAKTVKPSPKAKKIKSTENIPDPVTDKTASNVVLLTSTANLSSNYLGNITKTNKENANKPLKAIPEKKPLSRTDIQEVQNEAFDKNKSKHIQSNEVRFDICEESKKSTGTTKHPIISVSNSEIEVRPINSTATSALTAPISGQEARDKHTPLPSNPFINYNEWSVYQNKVFMDHERTLILLDKYVKNDMFHQLKFISCSEMMIFSWEEQSICQVVCTKFNVPKDGRISFWAQYSKTIIQKLNKKRSDVSNAMRKAFKGKYLIQSVIK